jgi:peptidoglycan/LPS O-acetylase OafA/YrhL
MKREQLLALVAFCLLIAFIVFISQVGDNDSKLYIGLIATLLVFALIGILASYARGATDDETRKQYFTLIGTLVGLVGGLVGGVAIGNQAGQTAADNVASTVESSADEVKDQVKDVKDAVNNPANNQPGP